MLSNIDLRKLSDMATSEKTCLSIYLASPDSLKQLERKFQAIRKALEQNDAEKDERDYFEENVTVVREYLEKHPFKKGSLCIFSCWALDYFKVHALTVPVSDLVWFDSSPYIRPLAELMDEYENVAVVVADNKKARIFLIASAVADAASEIKGNIKNHVKKGGWSQQRYERRRDKQLLLYVREIAASLNKLDEAETFRRIVLVGGKEALQALYKELPAHLQEKVAMKAVELHGGDSVINKEVMDLFFEQERESERALWEKIRSEHLRDGLGVVGMADVLASVQAGQADRIIVNRDCKFEGRRCRDCEHLDMGEGAACSKCGSDSVFSVDLVNEITEKAKQTGADIDFCDPIASLKSAGEIAALLRYKF